MPSNLSDNVVPGIGGNNTGAKSAKTADDINDMFKELDTTPDDKKVVDDTDDEELPVKAKGKESKEDDSEAEGDDDEELELKDPDAEIEKLDLNEKDDLDIDAPPRKREVLKKYPTFFKDFPFMEKMLYRDKQYNEMFGSFDDAKEAHEQSENFKGFEADLMKGDIKNILRGVKDSDEKAFLQIADDYLPALFEADKTAYQHVVANLNKHLIIEMFKEASKTDDEDLKTAALILNKFLFNSTTFEAPKALVDKNVDEKESAAEKARLAMVQERFETTRDDLQTRVDNTLKATIDTYIDPKNEMSPYVKRNAVKDALQYLKTDIAKDPSIGRMLDKLWREAFDKNFSRESTERLQKFYLGRAKGSLKDSIIKARGEALKGSNNSARKAADKDDEDSPEESKTPRSRGLVNPGRTSQPKGKNEMKRGESVADFFARD